MKLRAMIVEDEPIARQILQQYAKDDGRLEIIAVCKNGMEAVHFLHQNEVDLIFLDINMPKLSGLEMLKTLTIKPMVIFTTAYREYAVEGFELEALDYLVKPFSFQRFLQAINRAIEKKSTTTKIEVANFFFAKADGKNVKILYKDILYIEAMNEYVRIHTTSKKIMTLQSLQKMEANLPSDQFLRVHRSYLISLNKIEAIEGNQILIREEKIPVSKSYREILVKLVERYKV